MPCPLSPVISFSTPDNLLQAPTTLASGACWAYVHALGSSPQPAVGLELVVKSSASSPLGWDSSEICSTAPPRGYKWDWAQLPISSDLMVMVSSLPFSASWVHFPSTGTHSRVSGSAPGENPPKEMSIIQHLLCAKHCIWCFPLRTDGIWDRISERRGTELRVAKQARFQMKSYLFSVLPPSYLKCAMQHIHQTCKY